MSYISKISEIVSNWNTALNLDKVFKDVEPIALCLQAQSNLNESAKHFTPQFRRLNIPLVFRAFNESKSFNRNRIVNYFDEGVVPQITILKTKFNPPEADLNQMVDYTAQLATEIAKEFDKLFGDIMNEEIIFHGFGLLTDGKTMTLHYSKP